MPLILQIENLDRLPDGGPVRIVVGPQGCQAGRNSTMHWVLPDPSRMISGHHFDITYADGGWWLSDRSTNGTFLQGSRYRLDQPYRLRNMDRFQVGHYVIAALIEAPKAPETAHTVWPAPRPTPNAASGAFDPPGTGFTGGIWNLPASEPAGQARAPVDPWAAPAFDAPPPAAPFPVPPPAPNPTPFGASPPASGRMPGPTGDFADDFLSTPVSPPPPAPPASEPPPSPAALLRPARDDAPVPAASQPLSRPPAAGSAAAGPPAQALAHATADRHSSEVVRAFCSGAGLDPAAFGETDPVALAELLGRSLRLTTAEVMTQLQLRAAAKQFTRGGERTMRTAEHNNPLKFLPDVEHALEAMFLRPRAGFLHGPEALEEALTDLRRHQVALFAALQPALTQLLGDLSPESVEEAAGGGLLGGSRKAKAWETFVERWDAKTAPHENGILDAFLTHFAAAYIKSIAGQEAKPD